MKKESRRVCFSGFWGIREKSFLLTLSSAFFFTSCITSGPESSRKSSLRGESYTDGENIKLEKLFSNDSREISELYSFVLERKATGVYLPKISALLAKEKRSHLEEGILALNLIQTFIASHSQNQDEIFEIPFKEEKRASLAELSALYNIDLIDLIENNHFLQSVEVYHLFLRLREFHSGDEVNQLLYTAIDNKFVYFKKFVSLSEIALQAAKSHQIESARLKEIEDAKPKSEKILEEVEKLLAVNKYHEAIRSLKEIEQEDDSYSLAQKKIAIVSKRAVAELRRKAAFAYQNANHIDTDFRAREAYFIQAKEFLEDALKLYPDAEQADRVRMNLKVINDNLNFLDKGRLQKR